MGASAGQRLVIIVSCLVVGAALISAGAITGDHSAAEIVLEGPGVPFFLAVVAYPLGVTWEIERRAGRRRSVHAESRHRVDMYWAIPLFVLGLAAVLIAVVRLGARAADVMFAFGGGLATFGVMKEVERNLALTPEELLTRHLRWVTFLGRINDPPPVDPAAEYETAYPASTRQLRGTDEIHSHASDSARGTAFHFRETPTPGPHGNLLLRITPDGLAPPHVPGHTTPAGGPPPATVSELVSVAYTGLSPTERAGLEDALDALSAEERDQVVAEFDDTAPGGTRVTLRYNQRPATGQPPARPIPPAVTGDVDHTIEPP